MLSGLCFLHNRIESPTSKPVENGILLKFLCFEIDQNNH
eukprot:UN04571